MFVYQIVSQLRWQSALACGSTADQMALGTSPPCLVEVSFTNGSIVVMTLLQDNIEITTEYGKLVVPQKDIRQIEFGVRYRRRPSTR